MHAAERVLWAEAGSLAWAGERKIFGFFFRKNPFAAILRNEVYLFNSIERLHLAYYKFARY